MKKKLQLNDLQVESFVTTKKEMENLEGGGTPTTVTPTTPQTTVYVTGTLATVSITIATPMMKKVGALSDYLCKTWYGPGCGTNEGCASYLQTCYANPCPA